MTRRIRLKRNRRKTKLLRTTLAVVGIMAGALLLLTMGTIAQAIRDLPSLEKQATQRIAQTSKIYDAKKKIITTLHAEQNRVIVPLKKIPKNTQSAAIAIEDKRFYEHSGIDFEAIIRALAQNLKSGGVVEGGSTLTQQYVKNTLLSHERTINRKIKEAFLAYQMERKYDKKKILEKYLNTVYFGHGNYGVETAANYFFGKKAVKLTLSESALLAGLIRSPLKYSPYNHPEKAVERRNNVLTRMVSQKMITLREAEKAIKQKIKLKKQKDDLRYPAPYFIEYVKSLVMNDKRFGSTEQQRANALFKGGLKIFTTVDMRLQHLAEESARQNLNLPTDPTASMVSIEPKTGYVRAMVGGRNFFGKDPQAKFNLAYQGKRQTGSSFKVYVLVTALLQGMSPNKTYQSGPVTIPMKQGPAWHVDNYTEGKGYGSMSIAQGTVKSVNALYARLMMDVGAKNVVKTCHKLGITSPIEPNPAIALGGLSKGVSPFEMAVAMATLGDNGIRHKPIAITRIVDPVGKTIVKNKPKGRRAIPSGVAATATSVLQGVIKGGTGTAANIGRPAAGKTGTAQSHRDAWFIGYTPDLATAVWVGYPNKQKEMFSVHGVKVTGGSFPAQIWHDFMLPAHENIPVHDFPYSPYAPKEKMIRICRASGKLATEYCPENLVYEKYFDEDTAPTAYCDVHGGNSVPNVVGMSSSEAYSALNSAGFSINKNYTKSDKPEGTVVSQSPGGGAKAKNGTTVTIYVSKGGGATVPGVVGMSESSAVLSLRNAGFAVSVSRRSAPGQAGKVISQNPSGGSKAAEGSTVSIVVGR